jgi:hypothetical protein
MISYTSFLFVAAFLLTVPAATVLTGAHVQLGRSFPVATVRFEQNATDGDVEVVFEITGRSEGLTSLSVKGPDGRIVVDFACDESTSGIRQFVFESPEPTDIASIKAAYPEGVYTFEGKTASGAELHGKATLSHKLPATTSVISPEADSSDVAIKNVTITWKPVRGMIGYVVELEQEDPDTSITAKLPASTNSFAVPDGFLRPETECKIGIGTMGEDGNISYVETSFMTSKDK